MVTINLVRDAKELRAPSQRDSAQRTAAKASALDSRIDYDFEGSDLSVLDDDI